MTMTPVPPRSLLCRESKSCAEDVPLGVVTSCEASDGDAPAIAALFGRARAGMPYLPRLHTPEEDIAYFGRQIRQQLCITARAGGRILGFAICWDGWIHHLYVDVDQQSRGVGTQLLLEAMRRSAGELQLWTFQLNRGARRFYERHGFVAIEQTDGSGNEERVPDVRYQWRRA